MSFYPKLPGLDLTTGHGSETPDSLDSAVGRLIDPLTLRKCFGCHTTGSMTKSGFDAARATPGITCEACHGPGAKHAALMEAEMNEQGNRAIFNPKELSPIAKVDFCGACHRTQNDVEEMGVTGVSNVRFQPYRLEGSRCWGEGDARLACVACHDPHKPLVQEARSYDEKCLACHANTGAKNASRELPGKVCKVAKRDCVTCHMPKVVIPVIHAPFTDHRIRIVRKGGAYPD